ncbi:protein terminal ear1 [Quillaja saponaria]|uniref:Protein terminal ear1 n=1 Tax=Quillaja saponaria TaxID=32244 RepID=A0AAD7KTU0_QUISA|nr:protein terminal ear1 [Quillaja saponaria]
MGETGIGRFPGSLDPGAEEFRPRNPNHPAQPMNLFSSNQIYYPYTSPYVPSGGVQATPFCDGVPYAQFPVLPAYVSPPAVSAPPVVLLSSTATRAVLLSSVPGELVSETSLRRELEVFGEVRGVQMEALRGGNVTVHFYDLRHAETTLTEIRKQHMQHQSRLRNYYMLGNSEAIPPLPPPSPGLISGHAVWAQFVIPAQNAIPAGDNQGTIVIFNLDSEVSTDRLRQIFEAFGPVKEMRETPLKKNQKFVEFFDIRDAAKALKDMNGKEIHGKPVVIEYSRPGGHGRKFFNAVTPTNNYNVKSQNYPPPSQPPFPQPKLSYRLSPPDSHLSQTKFKLSARKSYFNKGSINGINVSKSSNSEGAIVTKMASMHLGSDGAAENGVEDNGRRYSNSKKSHSNKSMVIISTKQQQQEARSSSASSSSRTSRKGKQAKKFDSRFLIKEDDMVESNCRDSRTTVMIKNIPNKYSQKLLLNMLDNHCIHCNEQIGEGGDQPLSSYDFVYLPIDFNNKCNVGYGFVNMTTPEATLRLYKAFHLQHWEVFNSRKICEVTYARVQGLEALKEHFKNSKFPCEMDHYLPVVFSPPRDGEQLTEPLPIADHNQLQLLSIGQVSDEMDGPANSDQQDMLSSSSQNGGVDDNHDKAAGRSSTDEVD